MRAHSLIMAGALVATLGVKLFHAWRLNLLREYPGWIVSDVAVLFGIELVFTLLCYWRPTKQMARLTAFLAAWICAWSVANAGYVIRTGTQIPLSMFKPLVRDPVNTILLIAQNLIARPGMCITLFFPSVIALAMLFHFLARPVEPVNNRRRTRIKIVALIVVIVAALAARGPAHGPGSPNLLSSGMRFNGQLRAVTSVLTRSHAKVRQNDLENAKRKLPTANQVNEILSRKKGRPDHNVVMLILEGVQYDYTSLGGVHGDTTPYLGKIASEGTHFTNMRSTLTHTTKAIFSLLTGRYPSVSNDLAETVPAERSYSSLATILAGKGGYRTAFFQSAKGNFESRPGLVNNLGFSRFWARDYLKDPNSLMDPESFIGYLGCDEFALVDPIKKWIDGGDEPFLLTVLCSITHDPYLVPEWYGEPASEHIDRYLQTIRYTDTFIAALDEMLSELDIAEDTIFCVVGDHGEAFGEHGFSGHEMIAYEEALRVVWVMRAPGLAGGRQKVTKAVSSIDVTPTLLSLLGYDVEWAAFDGIDVLSDVPEDRKVYFSGWIEESPAGFVRENGKFVYYPNTGAVRVFDLLTDPNETAGVTLPEDEAEPIAKDIVQWCRDSVIRLSHENGRRVVFEDWFCRWNDRVTDAKFQPKSRTRD